MTWFGWVLVVVLVTGVLVTVGTIGKLREPLTPRNGTFVVAANLLLLWGTLSVGTGSVN